MELNQPRRPACSAGPTRETFGIEEAGEKVRHDVAPGCVNTGDGKNGDTLIRRNVQINSPQKIHEWLPTVQDRNSSFSDWASSFSLEKAEPKSCQKTNRLRGQIIVQPVST